MFSGHTDLLVHDSQCTARRVLTARWRNCSTLARATLLALARWCNGSTADSGSVCHGSNPCSGSQFLICISRRISLRLLLRDAFVKVLVAHHHRRGAAAGEAFDEFDRELSVLRGLQAVRVRIQPQLLAKMFVQFVRAAQRATQRAANLDLIFAQPVPGGTSGKTSPARKC